MSLVFACENEVGRSEACADDIKQLIAIALTAIAEINLLDGITATENDFKVNKY